MLGISRALTCSWKTSCCGRTRAPTRRRLFVPSRQKRNGFPESFKRTTSTAELPKTKADFSKLSSNNRNNGLLALEQTDKPDDQTISMDIKSLYNPEIHLTDKPDFNDPALDYEPGTPLSEELIQVIGLK